MPEPRPLQNVATRERSLSKKMSKKKGTEKEKETAPLRKGVVVRNTGSSYMVKEEDGTETACRVKGNFRIKGIRTTNPVAVGDHVLIQHASDDADYIVAVEPRRADSAQTPKPAQGPAAESAQGRPPAGARGKAERP